MKPLSAVLAVSLVANAVLLASWSALRHSSLIVGIEREPARSAADVGTAGTRGAAKVAPPAQSTATGLWQRLHADDDLRGLMARMRTAGFPEPVVRRVIRSLIAQRFDAKRYEVDQTTLNRPFWKPWPNTWADPKIGPQLRAIQREQDAMVKELLGADTREEFGEAEELKASLERRYGRLSQEKIDRLNAYSDAFLEKRAQLLSAIGPNGRMLPADMEKLAAVEKTFRNGLTEFLTPEEANEYILRSSTTGMQLSYFLGPVRLTEQEHRTVFPLYLSYAEQFPTYPYLGDGPNDEHASARKLATETLSAQLATALGRERAEEIQLSLNPQYSYLARLVQRLDLPPSTTKQVYATQRDIQQRATALAADLSLTAEQRDARSAALAAEATQKISSALGSDRAFSAYQQYYGEWLKKLAAPGGK